MKLSIVYKLSLSFTLLVLISSGVVGGLFYSKTTDLLVKHTLEDISGEVLNAGKMLQTIINTHDEDVLFLANTPAVQGLIQSLSPSNNHLSESHARWLTQLENIFEAQLMRKKTYLSIRFINKQGKELIHVGYHGSKIVRYRGDKLQDKSNRVYVQETLKLLEGSVYVSEINLNREFGEITEPHQEVKRSATPIYNKLNGELAGLIVVTAEIGHELRSMQNRLGHKKGSEFYITNDQGVYLVNADEEKTYSFDLGRHFRIQEDMPQLAPMYLPENNDLQVILMPDTIHGNKVINFTKIPFDAAHPKRFIAVIFAQDYDSIVTEQSKVLNDVSIWALLLILSSAAVGIILSIQIARPIKQMTRAMNDFERHRTLSITLPTDQKDEVGVLARSFESMMQQVIESQNKLRKLNNDLEEKVSERTKSLELSELHQRTILDSVADAIITIDNNSLISSFNAAAENMFLYSAEEAIGESISILLPEDELHAHQHYIQTKSILYETRIINQARDLSGKRKNGTLFPIELKVTSLKGGSGAGYVGVIRDITERKRMETMKSEFISTVSHELRTPLTSIHGAIGLINALSVDVLPRKIKNLLEIAENNTNRLLLLINDILDIQKIESDQMKFDFKCISALPVIKQAVEDNASYVEQYGLKIELKHCDTALKIMADKDRLMQVMENLISNAAKFSTESRSIEIAVSQPELKVVRVMVTNYGKTIPKEFLLILFDKFTQLDSSDSRQKGGTGLGLSIAKNIVDKHKGSIHCVSQNSVTHFYFDLPEC